MNFSINRFLVCRFLAALGDQFMLFAVPLVILRTTGSIVYSGLAFAIEWLPRLLFFPVSGNIADRVNIRKLYQWADSLRSLAVVSAGLIVYFYPTLSFFVLSTTMAILAILNSLAFVGMEATFPRQVPASELPKIQSMLQGIDQTSQILGPALAALATSLLPLQSLLFLGAFFFGVSALNSLSLPAFAPSENKKRMTWSMLGESYSESWKILKDRPILFQLCSLTWIVNLMYGTVLVIAPAVVTQTFALPERNFGILQTLGAVFGILMFFLIPGLCKKIGLPNLGALAFVGMAMGAVVAATAPAFTVFAVGVALLLGCDGMFNVYIRSLRAQIIPKADLGKTTGLIILINNCSLPMSGFAVSALSSEYSPQKILFILTSFSLVAGMVVIAFGRIKFDYLSIFPSLESAQTNQRRISA